MDISINVKMRLPSG